MNQFIFLKWCPNVKEQFYEQSKLKEKHTTIGNNVMETILQEGNEFIINTNNQSNYKSDKKRETQFEQMNQREMVAQTNLNPFLPNDYLEDLNIQEQYLTPQNSNL